MKIQRLSCLEGARRASGTVLIIDVYRAFTCQAVAFAQGAAKILLTNDHDEALRWKAEGRGDYTMGEVSNLRLTYEETGFDFDNSPRNFYLHDVHGKTLIQRTSAGVAGLCAAAPRADRLYAASFLTAEATVQAVLRDAPDVVSIVAMGAWEERTDEDELCAYYLLNRLEGRQPDKEAVKALVRTGNTYAWYLKEYNDGYPTDGEIALQIDACDFAIRVQREDGILVSRARL
ncbi:MAG TPA: 2-phosphosulfolactate phosphatase [Anaerolineae bacterium]|nr:2-phosphosulfolactate phosphatase [Anaerolineae bacterium]HQI85589.1 2-phosphosulfolactate phosphatase [Anaerolineae bacterium]